MSGYFYSLEARGQGDRVLLFVGQQILVRDGEFLWHRVLKIRLITVADVTLQFTVLNLIGIFLSTTKRG